MADRQRLSECVRRRFNRRNLVMPGFCPSGRRNGRMPRDRNRPRQAPGASLFRHCAAERRAADPRDRRMLARRALTWQIPCRVFSERWLAVLAAAYFAPDCESFDPAQNG
ncbi:hypothetical protein AcidC75_24720 [Acidisoma sp. C75]